MGTGTAVPALTSGEGYKHLLDPNRKWYNNKRLIILNAWITLLLITSSGNGFDGSLMNSFQSLDRWKDYFNHPHGSKLGLLNAIQNIGGLAGQPFAPYLSDGIGRKKTALLGAFIMLGSVAVQAAAQNLGMFIAARFLIGFGLTFAGNAAPMLITELAYPAYRAQLTALYNTLWYSGNIVASWTTFGTEFINSNWAWRIPSMMQGIPSLLQVFLVWFIPESPRWLVSKGRETQALRTLAYYHADGDETDALVLFEFNEIKAGIELDRTISRNVGWSALWSTPGNRRRMMVIIALAFFSQWSGNGLVSYYLNDVFKTIGITDTTIQLMITGILAVWNFFWAAGAAFLVERVGRRTMFITSGIGMIVFFTIQTICTAQYALHGNNNAAHAVIAFIFLYYAAYDIAFLPLIISYTLEILPYSLRAKGSTIFGVAISSALVFNQYINPIALDHLRWKYYIVYCCWLCFELVFLYLFIIETKGLSLEEIATVFDGEDAVRAFENAVHEVRQDDGDEKVSDEMKA